jgi:hypothetical protein
MVNAIFERGIGSNDVTERLFRAAADGHAVVYPSDPTEELGGNGALGYGLGNDTYAERTANSWASKDIETAPGFLKERSNYQSFSDDLSIGILSRRAPTPLTPEAPGKYSVLYSRRSSDGSFAPLFTVTPPNRAPKEFGAGPAYSGQTTATPVFAGASANFKRLFFEANDVLTPESVDGGEEGNNLYESVEGKLRLVNVLPNGTTEPNATFGGPQRNHEERLQASFIHVISEDGSRVFWTDLNTGDLYMRENGTRTVQIDASVGGGGVYWTASSDGSKVIFTKGGDLYEYRVDTGQTSDLAPGAEVQGLLGTSEDDSYIYFVASEVLAAGATQGECSTEQFQAGCNLYVWHEGEPVRFIARLSAGDFEFTGPGEYSVYVGDWRASLGSRTAEVTPDGHHLVFMSHAELTGYKFKTGQNLAEVYVYDFGGQISCASCNPTGAPPTHEIVSGFVIPSYSNTFGHRWISEDGTRVFFVSMDPLVAQDSNGKADVYEWEQDGAGACHTSGGCIYLLSGGTSPDNSYFADASTDGDDVFLVTRAQLVQQDENENMDLYDVRVGAASAPTTVECADSFCGESGSPVAPPTFAAPASSTFTGVGNVLPTTVRSVVKPKGKPSTCKKGSVRHKGKCVKKSKAKSKKTRRSTRRGK